MPSFLVEVYTPQARELAELAAHVRAAAEALAREGSRVRLVRSVFVPEDETCFHMFEGPSAEAVREAAERAALVSEAREGAVKRWRELLGAADR